VESGGSASIFQHNFSMYFMIGTGWKCWCDWV
jgi:hypothetical protein